jgi:hypothetical protein
MEINALSAMAYGMAKEKGWYDAGGPSALEKHMLIVTEIAEASEEVRNNRRAFYLSGPGGATPGCEPSTEGLKALERILEGHIGKPEGEAVELADAVIRIADIFGRNGWDLNAVIEAKLAYNATRPHRHGGKKL